MSKKFHDPPNVIAGMISARSTHCVTIYSEGASMPLLNVSPELARKLANQLLEEATRVEHARKHAETVAATGG